MNDTVYYCTFPSPVGELLLQGNGACVTGLYLPQHKGWTGIDAGWKQTEAPFQSVRKQLAEYFSGERQQFEIALQLQGTPFQQQVWQELARIPFGTTISYQQLAQRVGKPMASRAVGAANGRNPVSIIIPCHRVIGASGRLTGYAGGMDKKQWLLAWERTTGGNATQRLFEQENLAQ